MLLKRVISKSNVRLPYQNRLNIWTDLISALYLFRIGHLLIQRGGGLVVWVIREIYFCMLLFQYLLKNPQHVLPPPPLVNKLTPDLMCFSESMKSLWFTQTWIKQKAGWDWLRSSWTHHYQIQMEQRYALKNIALWFPQATVKALNSAKSLLN